MKRSFAAENAAGPISRMEYLRTQQRATRLHSLAAAVHALAALQSYQAPPGRFCNSFSAADDVHLGEDGFPMRLDGAFANK